jgi:predicted amidohydrolase YtcJ
VAVGSKKEIRKLIDDKTKIVDAKGKMVIPGLVDCHVHMTGFGQALKKINLRDVKSIRELQQKLKKYVQENSEKTWILGGTWDQEKFAEKRFPNRWDLDKAVMDKPVFLVRICGHVGVANTKALEQVGITRKTEVEGGNIDLDEVSGEPNGILRENAVELIWKSIPELDKKDRETACLMACEMAVKAGLTCVHWMLSSPEEMCAVQKLHSEGRLPLRVYLGIPVALLDEVVGVGLLTGFGDEMVKIGFIKILADGSLGGHTAALKEPYSDKPETCGMMLYTRKELERLIAKAHKAELQLAVHAIGDSTMEAILRAFEKTLKEQPREDHRHRIEHCSVTNPKQIRQMARLKLIASIQPHFIVSDLWIVDRVGNERARWVYPFKTFIKEGLTVISGSDCPVEPISPILGIWAAVARKNFPEEKLSVEEALRAHTLNAAYASYDENKRGTIESGKLADMTVLSDDLFDIPPDDIRNVKVEMTIVDGKIVYASKGFQGSFK